MVELVDETPHVRSIMLELPDWQGHRAGQHVDVRLTAEDGYQAERSYSIASGPEDEHVVITVERLDDGEVSPYLVGELREGDELELRGPIGGFFVWEEPLGGPVLLVGGGSGVVPLRAMLRHRSSTGSSVAMHLLYSARAWGELIYRDELIRLGGSGGLEVSFALTREWPDDWTGHRGRIDRELLEQVGWGPQEEPRIYICGPTGFVEAAAGWLVDSGHPPARVRTERFGPTGR